MHTNNNWGERWQDFEEDWGGIYEKVWRKEREGRNVVTEFNILKVANGV